MNYKRITFLIGGIMVLMGYIGATIYQNVLLAPSIMGFGWVVSILSLPDFPKEE